MPIPDFTDTPPNPVAGRVLAGLGAAFADRAGLLLPPLVHELTMPMVDTDEALASTDRGWAAIFDLDLTPQPAWLGNATGTRVPAYATTEAQRDYVRERPGWRRATPTSLLAAIRSVYPDGRVDITERDGSPWRISVRVYEAEADAEQQRLLSIVLEEQRPAGIILDLLAAEGATIAHAAAEHGPTVADLAADFPTVADLVEHIPEEGTIP